MMRPQHRRCWWLLLWLLLVKGSSTSTSSSTEECKTELYVREGQPGALRPIGTLKYSTLGVTVANASSSSSSSSSSSQSSCPAPSRLEFRHAKPLLQQMYGTNTYPLDGPAFLRSQPAPQVADWTRLRNVIRKLKCHQWQRRQLLIPRRSSRPEKSDQPKWADASEAPLLKVVVLGGSVPLGAEIPESFGGPWATRFANWLEAHPLTDAKKPTARQRLVDLRNMAVPGTNSLWRVAEISSVPFKDADVVIVDYTTNDMLNDEGTVTVDGSDSGLWSRLRCATEILVRRALTANPEVALIYLGLTRGWKSTGPDGGFNQARKAYTFQKEVYGAVLDHYRVPFVSFRDAIWPDRDHPPSDKRHLFDTKVTVHPQWYVHQLIADVLAFTWTNQETAQNQSLQVTCDVPATTTTTTTTTVEDTAGAAGSSRGEKYDGTSAVLPPPKFQDSDLTQLERCHKLTHYSNQNDSEPFEPVGTADGWKMTSGNRFKRGWEYNSTSFNASDYSTISFAVEFGARPVLAVTYMKSYRGFGAAAFWFGDQELPDAALARITKTYAANQQYARKCRSFWKSRDERLQTNSMNSPSCRRALSGMLGSPWVVNGKWADHSSQPYVAVYQHGWKALEDKRLPHNPEFYDMDESAPLVEPNSKTTINFRFFDPSASTRRPTRGRNNKHQAGNVDSSGRFKVMGILTC